MGAEPSSGHRVLPHTADMIIEAWGADELACAEEAARALLRACVAGQPDPGAGFWVADIGASRRDLVRDVLEEVIVALDMSELTPVAAGLERISDSVVTLRLALAPRASVHFVGPAPKAIVMLPSERTGPDAPSRCRFIVDV